MPGMAAGLRDALGLSDRRIEQLTDANPCRLLQSAGRTDETQRMR